MKRNRAGEGGTEWAGLLRAGGKWTERTDQLPFWSTARVLARGYPVRELPDMMSALEGEGIMEKRT